MQLLSSKHEVICFGEVLWDIFPSGLLPGRVPMNVASHLKKLDNYPAIITKVGVDDYEKKLINLFSDIGISTNIFLLIRKTLQDLSTQSLLQYYQ